MSSRTAADILASLIGTMPDVVANPKLAGAAIADVLECTRAERRALVVAVEIGLPLQFKGLLDAATARSRMNISIRNLIAEGFSDELSHWAVSVWAMCFGHTGVQPFPTPDATASTLPVARTLDPHESASNRSVPVRQVPSLRKPVGQGFAVGESVHHAMYGSGKIDRIVPQPNRAAGDVVVVKFDRVAGVVQFSAAALAAAIGRS